MNIAKCLNFPTGDNALFCRAGLLLSAWLLVFGLALFSAAPLHAAQDAPAIPEAEAAEPAPTPAPAPTETRELWTGKLYSSTYRAGVCLKNDGTVRGVLLLRVPSGKVDVYHFYGQHAGGKVSAKHSSGHTFEGQFENAEVVSGTVTLKSGFTVQLEGQRTHDVELTETCRPLPD